MVIWPIINYNLLKMFLQKCIRSQAALNKYKRGLLPSQTYYKPFSLDITQMTKKDPVLFKQVLADIEKKKKIIADQSKESIKLAQNVLAEVPEDYFGRDQRYKLFIDKMSSLQRKTRNFERKKLKSFQKMQVASVMSITPIKFVMQEYNTLMSSGNGFDCDTVAKSMVHLKNALDGRGALPRGLHSDYQTLSELDQSWRFTKVADDLTWALTTPTSAYFRGTNMASVSRSLGNMGYKNTDLVSVWCDRLGQILAKEIPDPTLTTKEQFHKALYGGQGSVNYEARHYIYRGFEDNEEFQDHVDTLIQWQQSQEDAEVPKKKSLDELSAAMEELVETVSNLKTYQIEKQAAIEAVRRQFFTVQQATYEHDFLQEDEYLKFDFLELESLLVKGGYVTAEEAITGPQEQSLKMAEAANIFHDHVVNYQSELLSPQYEDFIDAAVPKKESLERTKRAYEISLGDLSSTLIGLNKQTLSFRRDALDKDYPNKTYEDICMPYERHRDNEGLSAEYKAIHLADDARLQHVVMERSYLKGWQTFMKKTENFLPAFADMITNTDKDDIDGQLRGFGGLSACKFSAPHLRDQIIKNCKSIFERNPKPTISIDAAIDGLWGLTGCDYQPKDTKPIIKRVLKQLENKVNQMTISQAIGMLSGIYGGGFEDLNPKICRKLFDKVDTMHIDRVNNELTYDEFETLKTIQASAGKNGFKNKALYGCLNSINVNAWYEEAHAGQYDPLKERLVTGLSAGLAKANLHTLHTRQQLDQEIQSSDSPCNPDILMSFGGQKTGVYIANEHQSMRDTKDVDGFLAHKMKLASKHASMKVIGVPLTNIIDYDLADFKLKLKPDFKLSSLLDEEQKNEGNPALGELAQNMSENGLLLDLAKTSRGVQQFLAHMTDFLESKERDETLYQRDEKVASKSNTRFKLLKLSLVHDVTLNTLERDLLASLLPSGYPSFQSIILALKDEMTTEDVPIVPKEKWEGIRLGIELPAQEDSIKSIEPEMLNRTFLWNEDYQHYDDWDKMMKESYDNFNLLIMPPKTDEQKLFFEDSLHRRRYAVGITPLPNHKRVPLKLANRLQDNLRQHTQSDPMNRFAANPHADMIKREQEVAQTLKPISDDLSMITNLSNVKQGLKSDLSDKQILQTILLSFDFTDQLIEEHLDDLNKVSKSTQSPKYVPRNAADFRKFMSESSPCEANSSFKSQFSHFYMKEALIDVKAKAVADKIIQLTAKDTMAQAQGSEVHKLELELEEILIARDRIQNDNMSLGHTMANKAKINADMKSLQQSGRSVTRAVKEEVMNDQNYLDYRRRVCESSLIKSKIIYKVNKDLQLTKNESLYLKKWVMQAQTNKESILGHQTMVPSKSSQMKIEDLKPEDMYAFNQISGVELKREKHGAYALNDLVVEVGHFIDTNTLRKVELTCLENKLRSEWQLGQEFSLVDSVNNESLLLMQELEEVAWREAGHITQQDMQNVQDVVSVRRGSHDSYDQAFYGIDMQSMEEFVSKVNCSEDRIDLLENWLVRKEQEIWSRANMPSPDLAKSDEQIYNIVEAPIKKARESLASKLLSHDEAGKPIASKPYAQMTTHELHLISENIAARLNMFYSSNKTPSERYPPYMPQVVKAIMEHPHIANTDANLLDTYCHLFELDWRGDRHIHSQDNFMSSHPVYVDKGVLARRKMEPLDNDKMNKMLQDASVPFLGTLTNKMFELAGLSK